MKKNQADKRNLVIIASSEEDANLYYATCFVAPDPILFVQIRGKRHLIMNDLEIDRARQQARVDRVHSLSKLAKAFREKTGRRPGYGSLVAGFLKQNRVRRVTVPASFPVSYADTLRAEKIRLDVQGEPFFEQRVVKDTREIRAVEKAIRHTQQAIRKALGVLRKSVIKRGRLYYGGTTLTSEELRKVINVDLMENGCIAQHSIVACGEQAVDPHNEGSGPLYAHQSIILDIFPRDGATRYHADITRTVVRGEASDKLREVYRAVRDAQKIGFNLIRDGIDGSAIHRLIQEHFEENGFQTGIKNGRMQGFFHGTGHGLGLDVHEEPRISLGKSILRTGHIVTVEPGLYYPGIGGVRIEDDVLVTRTGCRILSSLPRVLEIK